MGREAEVTRIGELIAAAREGHGGSLVLLGEAGIGKTTLLDAAAGLAAGLDVVRVSGSQSEHGVPFAGLHALLDNLATEDALAALPDLQRDGLLVALGRRSGPPPGSLVVGAAVLGVLASSRGLCVLVDDLQWLDAASLDAITFTARRLVAEPVAVIATVRTVDGFDPVRGLPAHRLDGLVDARAVLPGVHPRVVERLRDATAGNPLAMIEAAAGLTPSQAAGEVALPRVLPPTNPERMFARRLDSIEQRQRQAARILAVCGRAPADVLARALATAGCSLIDLDPLVSLGLCQLTDPVSWIHPLARSAAGRGDPAAVRAAHRAAAQAWGEAAPARAWHLADSAVGPDEEAAVALAEVARAAESRDAGGDAADAWERAASLTRDEAAQAQLWELAARAALRSGATRRAAGLLDRALLRQSGSEQTARLLWQRGRIQHTLGDPSHGLGLFLQAVDLSSDPDLRVWAAAEGLYAAMYAGRPDQAARMAELVGLHHDPRRPVHAFLADHAAGAAASLNGDPASARIFLDRARALLDDGVLDQEPQLLLWAVNLELFDPVDLTLTPLLLTRIDQARRSGDLTWLPRVTHLAARRAEVTGDWSTARALTEECELLSRATGQETQLVEALVGRCEQDALHGDTEALLRRLDELSTLAVRTRSDWLAGHVPWVRALAALTQGDLETVVDQLRPTLSLDPESLPLVVDALLRAERRDEAVAEIDRHPDAPHAVLAASRALVAGDVEGMLRWVADRDEVLLGAIRAQLVGERLRRLGHRAAAREQLRAASAVFAQVGAGPWEERAQSELRASGATLRRRGRGERLTPSEERVARLAAQGQSNKDVAAVLFLSPKTVEFHLGNAYRKLGVENRTALAHALDERQG